MTTDKHREMARELVRGVPINVRTYNLDWRITQALDEAYRNGMRRAADYHHGEAARLGPDIAFSRLHRASAAAILSEIEASYD